jgi:hypothetical protein
MLCYGFLNKGPRLQCYGSLAKDPSRTMWFRHIIKYVTKYVTKYDTKNNANPHSTEQDTLPTAFLICKQVIPYWTHGGTCCPGGLLLRFGT